MAYVLISDSNVAGIIILANVAQRAQFCLHKQRSGQSNHSTPCLCIIYYNWTEILSTLIHHTKSYAQCAYNKLCYLLPVVGLLAPRKHSLYVAMHTQSIIFN